jgi:hypothetical protein
MAGRGKKSGGNTGGDGGRRTASKRPLSQANDSSRGAATVARNASPSGSRHARSPDRSYQRSQSFGIVEERGTSRSRSPGAVRGESTADNKNNNGEGGSGADAGVNVVCVVENRAREVCLCLMNTHQTSLLTVFSIADNHSYAESLSTLAQLQPAEVGANT